MKSAVPHGRWAILSLALAVLPLMTATAQKPPPKGTPQFAPDRVLVAFKQTVKQEARLAAVARVGLQVDTRVKSDFFSRLIISPQKLASGMDVKKAIAALKVDPAVRVAEPDWIVHSTSVPNDPYFRWQWALRNDRQFGGKLDADIDIPKAWDVTRGSPSMKVAVIDTGVGYTHDDLAANILRDSIGNPVGYDFHNRDANPMDDNGHGTHVSGIIGAVGNNRIGISGVCQTVKIIPIKFLGSDGYGNISDAILSTDLARLLGARIMNNSWTGGGFSTLLLEAIQRARAVGILYVAAAGNAASNNDVNPGYPGSLNRYADNVVAVAASDVSDNIAWFSNYGTQSVDIAAPGDMILSTVPGNSFDFNGGTSMAAPYVSGTAALVLSKYPTLKYWQVKTRLTGNADRPSGIAGKVRSGRLNAAGALVVDTIAPSAPKLFCASLRGLTALRLQWTAGGDDNAAGRAADYQLRFSTQPITAANFLDATQIAEVPVPAPSGTVQSTLETELSPGTTYYFALRSIDNGGNASPIVYATGTTRIGEKILEDGAEGTPHFTGWPTTTSAAHTGTKCYTDSPDANYESDVDLSLTSEPITLPASGEPFVSFWSTYALEEGYDYVYVGVSTDDGATYTTLDTFTGVDYSWNRHVYSLKPYAGQTIRVQFRIITDPIINEDGFYVDDIVIGKEESVTLFEDSVSGWGDLLFDLSPPWDFTDYTFHSPYWSYTDSYDWLYENNEDTSLVQATSVYLPEDVIPALSFWIHYDLEDSYDFLYVEVSADDGTTWNILGWLTGWHGGFEQIEIPLTKFVGKSIKVRFHLVTDSSVRKDGVYIDDIKIAGENLVPYSLTKVSADVKTAPAGSTVPFKAKLKRADNSEPIAGQRIDFYANPTNTFLGFGITDATGTATIMVTAPPAGVKKVIKAEFAGDTSYAPSTGSGSITGQ